jgi:hypothetical protein
MTVVESPDLKLLLHGIDTIQCAYYLQSDDKRSEYIDYGLLAREKESIRQSRKKRPVPIMLGNTEFLLHPYGSSSGYPIIISNGDFKIEMGEFNMPNFFVTFTSEALWRESAYDLSEKFLKWADSVGYGQMVSEKISRVDFCFDYKLTEIDFDEDFFVSYSKKDSKHRECGTVQTFTFGKDDVVLRVYDKIAEIKQQSEKVWFYILWGQETDVWRIEWQIRKAVLKQFGIVTFTDLKERQGNLLHYLAYDHDTLHQPNDDSNRSRWPLHPLWKDLQENIDNLYSLEVSKVLGQDAVLSERMMQMAISIYGYLKRVAAVRCVQNNVNSMELNDAIYHIAKIIHKIHEPLQWRMDVEERRKEILLGKW